MGTPVPPILSPVNGYLFLDNAKSRASSAADVGEERAAFTADSQVPWGFAPLSGTINEPTWKIKPSWYPIATEDKMMPPSAQCQMTARAGATVADVPVGAKDPAAPVFSWKSRRARLPKNQRALPRR